MVDLSAFRGLNVLVVGDAILDRYIVGDVERISPEAPVPVLQQRACFSRAGGAGNVACNVASLGGKAKLVAVVGCDSRAATLKGLFDVSAVDFHAVADTGRPTTCKTRLLAGSHQLVRFDEENDSPVTDHIETEILSVATEKISDCAAMVLSDYGKGVLTPSLLSKLISLGRKYHVPVIVDPKSRNFDVYVGATIITPNRKELTLATGLNCVSAESAEKAMRIAAEQTGAAILLTRSEQGMSLLNGDSIVNIPTQAIDVFDVSGAGDTVVAAVAMAVGSGFSLGDAANVANIAAGIAVSKVGTATVSLTELEAKFPFHLPRSGDITSTAEMVSVRKQWGQLGHKVGFTNGCFDLLHPGHVSLLKFARSHCDKLIVGINSDASVRRLKGESRPVQDQNSRREVLLSLRHVDDVVIFDEDTPLEIITALKPDLLVKGADYAQKLVVGASFVLSNGGSVELAPITEGQSTTSLVEKAKGRNPSF